MSDDKDPVADDMRARNPATGDTVAGEQVLADDADQPAPTVAPEQDDFHSGTSTPGGSDDSSAGVSSGDVVEETDADRAERHN